LIKRQKKKRKMKISNRAGITHCKEISRKRNK
jgi:hypothetical protein